MKTTFLSLIQKSVMAFLLSFLMLTLPASAQENNEETTPDFIEASLKTLNLEDFKTREIVMMDMTTENYGIESHMKLKINNSENVHQKDLWDYDSSGRLGIILELEIIEKEDLENGISEKQLLQAVAQGTLETVFKDKDVYLKISELNLNYQTSEEDGSEEIIDFYLASLEEAKGKWYKIPYSEESNAFLYDVYLQGFGLSQEAVFGGSDLESFMKEHMAKMAAGETNWKEGILDMMDVVISNIQANYGDGDDGFLLEQKEKTLEAMEQILNSELFIQRELEIGQHAGSTHFQLNKFALINLIKNVALLLDGAVYEEEMNELKAFLSNMLLMGRYKIDEETGLPDYFMLHFNLKNTDSVKNLSISYGNKLWAAGTPNTISAPTEAESLDEMFGFLSPAEYDVNPEPDYNEEILEGDEYSYCAIRSTEIESEEHLANYFVDCASEDEAIVESSFKFYLEIEDLNVEITQLPDGQYYYQCHLLADNNLQCQEIEGAEHDEVYEMDSIGVSVDCYKNNDEVYECEYDPYFEETENYEFCFVKKSGNTYYADCSGEEEELLKQSLSLYLEDDNLQVQTIHKESGLHYYTCEKQIFGNVICNEVDAADHDEVYNLEYEEKVFDCYKENGKYACIEGEF